MLVQATKDGGCMKTGQYGLVEENDPLLIFDVKPYPDPCQDMSGDEVDAFCVDNREKMMMWLGAAAGFSDLFRVGPKTGWRFVEACRKAGYEDRDGSAAMWFFHKAGAMLEKK